MITGAMLSVTVKVVLQVTMLPAASVTVITTGVTPVETRVPAAGDWVITRDATAVQLSVATTLAVKSGTAAWQLTLAKADWGGAQVMITGAMLSVTVNVVLQVTMLPEASVTVITTGVTPVETRVPAIGD